MICRAASFILFFATLLGSGTLLSELQPFALVPVLGEKFAWFAAHAEKYDTLFLGSSRVYRGIDPAAFDELTAAAGMPTHSFNFGVDAMSPPEDAYVLEHIAKLRPKGLRWVFIETGTIRPGVGYGGDDNVRSLHWHDTSRTSIALQSLLSPQQAPPGRKEGRVDSASDGKPLKRVMAHAQLWCERTMNAGRGASLLQRQLSPPKRVHLTSVLGRKRNGYLMPNDDFPKGEERADYERRMKEPARISYVDRHSQRSLDGMVARLNQLAARPIFVIPPTVGRSRQYPQAGSEAPVLDYGEAAKWPELYQIDHRTDRSHLNGKGSALFTRALAADFIELARKSAESR